MSNFYETLKDLILEKNINNKILAAEIGLSASCITDYALKNALPSIRTLVKLADYFNCSTDYLLGRESDQYLHFKKCPPFSEQIVFLTKYFGCKPVDIYGSGKISKSNYFDWKKGKRQPTLDNVIKLAERFDCRIDFILGRES